MDQGVMEQEAPRLLRDKSIKHYRLFPFELNRIKETRKVRAEDGTETEETEELYEFSICSDAGIERFDWWTGERFLEVLSLEPGALVSDYLDAGASVLLNHRVGQLVGRTRGWSIDGKEKGKRKVRARMRWSPLDAPQSWGSPQGVKAEVDAEVRGFTSVGYEVLGWEQTKKGDPAKGELSEYTCTGWRIFEWSFVDIPADISVGDGRSRARFRGLAGYDDGRPVTEERKAMSGENGVTPPAASGAGAGGAVTVDHAAEERKRIQDIRGLMRTHNRPDDEVDEAISKGTSAEEYGRSILAAYAAKTGEGTARPPRERSIELPKKERQRYSYRRALAGLVAAREGTGKVDGLELEVHQELMRHVPQGYAGPRSGVMIPLTMLDEEGLERVFNSRALDSKTGGKGAELIPEVAGDFIAQLVPQSVLLRMGATVLTGLRAPIAFPKQTGGMTFYWVGENPASAVPASDIALGLSLLSPRQIMGKGSVSRQLLMLSNPSVEVLIRREMSGGHGRAIDRAGIHGKGAAGEPQGIYKTPGVSVTTTFGAPAAGTTYGKLVDFQGTVSDKNAPDDSRGFLTTPLLAAKYRQTLEQSGIAGYIWNGGQREGVMAGERAVSSGQVSKTMTATDATGGTNHGLIYGNFADVIFGSWAGLEIIVDEITEADKAMVKFISFGMEDVMLRYPEAFAVADGATL